MKPIAEFLQEEVRPLAPSEFEEIRQVARRAFGLDLKAGKEELVSARLRRLACAGNFHSFREYCRHVVADRTGESLAAMIDALATNHTAFLREADHFQFLREQILPSLAARDGASVWSAACSTGEEVWTLACLIAEAQLSRRIPIAGSDISGKALRAAAEGVYPVERCRELPAPWLQRYFRSSAKIPRTYVVDDELRRHVRFQRINLIERFFWPKPFAVIFCRNVMIYFDRETQERVVRSLVDCLEPGGYLFVGHAESLSRISHSLEYVRPAIYRKPGKWGDRWPTS